MEASKKEVTSIVPDGHVDNWLRIRPLVFYRNDKPFGLIATVFDHDNSTVIINSISKDDQEFTFEMNKVIILTVRNNTKVMLMSTCKESCLTRLLDTYHENGVDSFFTKGF